MLELLTWRRSPWSLFDEIESLHEDLSRMVSEWMKDSTWQMGGGFPPLNVWSSPDGIVVDAELPGVDPNDLEVSVHEDALTIAGKVNGRELQEGEKYLRRERPVGEFSRTVQLPFRASSEGVKASYKNGVLRVVVPRAEEDKPRRITVESA